jgi:hypothetical protein
MTVNGFPPNRIPILASGKKAIANGFPEKPVKLNISFYKSGFMPLFF